ncbi:MAG: hypothetical protein JWQ40_1752 [Segetibacter sp.]|nr:hypothetical protein [Segetibacter sp.]
MKNRCKDIYKVANTGTECFYFNLFLQSRIISHRVANTKGRKETRVAS